MFCFFFFQAEDGIRDDLVTGVQTCALPIALIWSALRLGRHGATVAITVAACFAIWETTREIGPFAYESVTYSVLSTQLYIAVAALSTLFLSAVVEERERTGERLTASRA